MVSGVGCIFAADGGDFGDFGFPPAVEKGGEEVRITSAIQFPFLGAFIKKKTFRPAKNRGGRGGGTFRVFKKGAIKTGHRRCGSGKKKKRPGLQKRGGFWKGGQESTVDGNAG